MSTHTLLVSSKKVSALALTSLILINMFFAVAMMGLAGCASVSSTGKSSPTPAPATLQITTSSLPTAVVAANYSATLAAKGGTPPYTWGTTAGTLPAGLQLNSGTGAIAGTPTSAGNFSFTAQVVDATASSSSAKLAINVSAAVTSAPTISSVAPTSGPATGGTTVNISGANFLAGDNVLFGSLAASKVQVVNSSQIQAVTPAEQAGTVNVIVQDSNGQSVTASKAFTFAASVPALQITTSSLPAGTVGSSYSAGLAATGGSPPYSWGTIAGALPNGLQLSSTTGAINGTPSAPGSFSFTARVTDANTATSSAALSLSVSAPAAPTISTVVPASGPIAGGTAVTISGANFRTGDTVLFGSGTASAVQVVSSSQIQSITPAESAGLVSVTVQDSSGQKATDGNAFAFAVPPLQVTTPSLPGGVVGTNYSGTLTATGGTPPYSWSTTSGALPTGLQLNASSGQISGTPSAAGSASFTVQAKDASSDTASAGLSINIAPSGTSGPTVSLTSPANGATLSGKVSVSATATDSGSSIASVQFFLDGLVLGNTLSSSPYSVSWDTTQINDGNHNLWAVATNAAGLTATSAKVTVQVSNASWNPAILGVSWSSDFNSIAVNIIDVKTDSRLAVLAKGDGVTDDTAAIRGAVQLASSLGGGLVYFPTGDYKIVTPSNATQASPLALPSRVILRGVSSATSRLFVNDSNAASETDGIWTWGGIRFSGSTLIGMTDLGVYAVNSSTTSPCAVLWNRGAGNASELFLNNLDVHLTNCRSIWFESTTKLLLQNSTVDSIATQQGPIDIVRNSEVSFLNNTVTYHYGRVHLYNNSTLLMQGNSLTRDAQNKDMDNNTAVESGGVEISFDQNVQVLNNTIQTLNGPSNEVADGEAIMSQNSNTPDLLDAGTVSASTSTTLADASALWSSVTASRVDSYPEVVAIISGNGIGQWRTIQSINTSTKTLTVSQPWNPVPEPGSLYSIFVWTLSNATIQGNTLINNPNGIVIYDGCYTCTVQNNVLTSSRGIILRTVDEIPNASTYPESRRVHQIALNSQILNNTVSNTTGLRPGFIALDTEAFAPQSYNGMGMMNIQIGGNMINPYAGNPSQVYTHNEISQDGYFPCFLFGPASVQPPVTTVFQNVNFWNNSQSATVTYTPSFIKFATQSCVTASAP
jgi:parallel beta-helix repeat protein